MAVVLIAIGLVILVPAVSLIHFAIVQSRNMALARDHIAVVKTRIAGDCRFSGLEFSEFTAENGSLLIQGSVAQADFAAIQKIVSSGAPPIALRWYVTVLTPGQVAERNARLGLTTRPATVPAE